MSAMAGAMVLAWVCLLLLVFAMAGLLQQVRQLREDLASMGARPVAPLLGRQVTAFAGSSHAAVLVVDPGCSRCGPVYEEFLSEAPTAPELRWEVLTFRSLPAWPIVPAVRLRVDEDLVGELDVPWSPALLVVDPDGTVVSARPIESPSELRAHLAELTDAVTAAPVAELTKTRS